MNTCFLEGRHQSPDYRLSREYLKVRYLRFPSCQGSGFIKCDTRYFRCGLKCFASPIGEYSELGAQSASHKTGHRRGESQSAGTSYISTIARRLPMTNTAMANCRDQIGQPPMSTSRYDDGSTCPCPNPSHSIQVKTAIYVTAGTKYPEGIKR